MKLLSRLFGNRADSRADGLEQVQREAILDLLLYCSYADHHLSLAEDDIVRENVDRFDWESGTTVEIYTSTATARVRGAIDDSDRERQLLEDIGRRLSTKASRDRAKKAMSDLFKSDAETGAEHIIARKVRDHLD